MTVKEKPGASDDVEVGDSRQSVPNDADLARVVARVDRVRVGERMMLPVDDVAAIVGRSPAAARQLASRARRRVQLQRGLLKN